MFEKLMNSLHAALGRIIYYDELSCGIGDRSGWLSSRVPRFEGRLLFTFDVRLLFSFEGRLLLLKCSMY